MSEQDAERGPQARRLDGVLLRIYVLESDRWQGQPLYEAIVQSARSFGVAGTTVLRGIEGFGRSRRPHTTRIFRLSFDLPVVVEIADTERRTEELSAKLGPMVETKFVTWERLTIVNSAPWILD